MKKSKRLIALAATLIMGATVGSTFVGCGETGDKEDPTKANLTVATYDGGVGREWLEEAAQRFMDLHVNSTHFQEGRTGVKIRVYADRTKYSGSYLADRALNKDMYFTEGVAYYTYVNRGKVANISDVVKGDMSAYDEEGTIENKLDESFQNYLTAKDGEYYMLPFYSGFYGFIYDIELFEEAGFYYDEDGDFLALRKKGDVETEDERNEFEEAKSSGPDGVKGNYDDGLPATYQQFIDLATYIKDSGYVPFCYSGNYVDYVDKAFRSFAADYEGYDAFKLNYTFSGTDVEVVKKVNDDGTLEMETVDISEDNAYDLQRQAGRYYSLMMQEKLFGSTTYVGGTWNGFEYLGAQSEFIKSKYTKKRYAMLAEGVWWENEASATFTQMGVIHKENKEDRRFGFLPIPKATEEKVGEQQTMLAANRSFGFINAKCENMDLAKEFMKFLHSDAEMSKFSATTSIPRSLNYKVSPADRATATTFGKSLIDMVASAKVVYPYSSLDFVVKNDKYFAEGEWFFTSSVGGRTLNSPFTAFTAEKKADQASVKDYFNGLCNYQKSIWSSLQK